MGDFDLSVILRRIFVNTGPDLCAVSILLYIMVLIVETFFPGVWGMSIYNAIFIPYFCAFTALIASL